MNVSVSKDFRDAFFDELYNIAKRDKNVVLLMADQGAMSFEKFRKVIPNQLINVGIAEQNMIGVAAGLSLIGKKVFVHAICNFTTLRCFEQIKVDLSIMHLPVTIVGVGAGFAYTSDGPTHHANQDIAAMHSIPQMTIYNGSDSHILSKFVRFAYKNKGPTYIRFDKGQFPNIYQNIKHNYSDGMFEFKGGNDILIISTGIMVHKAIKASKIIADKKAVSILDIYRLKPFNEKLFLKIAKKYKTIMCLEEHIPTGGLSSIVSQALSENQITARYKRISLNDENYFVYGDRDFTQEKTGLGLKTLSKKIQRYIDEDKKI